MATTFTSVKTKGNVTVGAAASAAGIALGILGTLFFTGNLVSTQTYTTSRLINNTIGVEVVTQTGSTATGGLKSGGTPGNYQAVTIVSPMSATNAPLNGIGAGTGVINLAQLDPVAPQVSGTITCSVANVSIRGTGGTIVISRRTLGTGALILASTGSVTIGPTESFRCAVNPAPPAGFNVKALLKIVPSQVIN